MLLNCQLFSAACALYGLSTTLLFGPLTTSTAPVPPGAPPTNGVKPGATCTWPATAPPVSRMGTPPIVFVAAVPLIVSVLLPAPKTTSEPPVSLKNDPLEPPSTTVISAPLLMVTL